MPNERLQKILASAGVASRRGAEALIAAGRVRVDGRVATLGEQVDPAEARIEVDGRVVALRPPTYVYLALNKPGGVTSTVRDRHALRTVVELVPEDVVTAAGHLFPVGRLDQDSEGLILLTNDGAWAERVTHPRYGVEREYAIGLVTPLDARQRDLLAAGIELDEGTARVRHLRPATRVEVRQLADVLDPLPTAATVWYRATIAQGWKRQLRRMFAAVGAPVQRLVRVRIGPVWLTDLAVGEVRGLSSREVRSFGGRGAQPESVRSGTAQTFEPAPPGRAVRRARPARRSGPSDRAHTKT